MASGNGSNGFEVVGKFSNRSPKSERELLELEKNLESNKTALLQFKEKRDNLHSKIESLEIQIQITQTKIDQCKEKYQDSKSKYLKD